MNILKNYNILFMLKFINLLNQVYPSLDDYIPLRDAGDEEEKKCMEEEEYLKWKDMLDDDKDDDKEEDKKKK